MDEGNSAPKVVIEDAGTSAQASTFQAFTDLEGTNLYTEGTWVIDEQWADDAGDMWSLETCTHSNGSVYCSLSRFSADGSGLGVDAFDRELPRGARPIPRALRTGKTVGHRPTQLLCTISRNEPSSSLTRCPAILRWTPARYRRPPSTRHLEQVSSDLGSPINNIHVNPDILEDRPAQRPRTLGLVAHVLAQQQEPARPITPAGRNRQRTFKQCHRKLRKLGSDPGSPLRIRDHLLNRALTPPVRPRRQNAIDGPSPKQIDDDRIEPCFSFALGDHCIDKDETRARTLRQQACDCWQDQPRTAVGDDNIGVR